ncbi:hypothetical protein BGY98DRAFT_971071, partial [Russula aff. rugulosa BPL654]
MECLLTILLLYLSPMYRPHSLSSPIAATSLHTFPAVRYLIKRLTDLTHEFCAHRTLYTEEMGSPIGTGGARGR